jgi:nicotinate phosphoribosyltransferase
MIDLAQRVHNHNYKLDPIVRSLMDTDFYKLLMHQQIWHKHRNVDVTFAITNRSHIPLADLVSIHEFRDQLDYVASLRFLNNELIWLGGNTFYGQRGMFEQDYLEHLKDFKLPNYDVRKTENGQFIVEFVGKWHETTLWEIYALEILNTLRNRALMRTLSGFELDILYSKAKTRLWQKLQKLRYLVNLNLTDFGTRRRHDFLFQEWAVLAASEALGKSFTGTSNAFLAMKHGLEAKGTNAHEQPMVLAALANNNVDLKASQYDVCREWQESYNGALLVALPDTFGTTQFLRDAPLFIDKWTGFRFDSKPPIEAGEEAITFWQQRGVDPKTKLGIFSDGLDVEDIILLHKRFNNRMRIGFGWGTFMTNDFRDCLPNGGNELDPISLVCKVKTVNGRPAVKLSDNPAKATGNKAEITRYIEVFGIEGSQITQVSV